MGLFKAGVGAFSSVLADQWREYFYCDSMDESTLAVRGSKRVGARSSNTRGGEEIISDGSIIAVNEGQCMMIVDQGAIVEFCAEAGEFVYDASSEPSVFFGSFGEAVKRSFQTFARRFTFGGDTARQQRVYFFNTKEIIGNKYGTANPVPFRVVDQNIGLDIDISIRCHGEYSYKITDPILFYKNVCGNVQQRYVRGQLDSQLKAEFLTALQPAFARISQMGVRYSALPGHTQELADALNEALSDKWSGLRGVSVVSVGVASVTASQEDEDMIKGLQREAVYRNAQMAGAAIASAQADAMRAAASNTNAGPVMAFAGMNMAQNAGGANAAQLLSMQQTPQTQNAPADQGWKCPACGMQNTGNFCVECGQKRPVQNANVWICSSCGTANKGRFCMECGAKKPADAPLYRCDKCGWEPDDPKHPPRFCPECGDPFDDKDMQES